MVESGQDPGTIFTVLLPQWDGSTDPEVNIEEMADVEAIVGC